MRRQQRAPAATSNRGRTVRCRGRSSSLNRSRTGTPLAARSEISSAPASLRFSCGSPTGRRRRPGCQDRAPGPARLLLLLSCRLLRGPPARPDATDLVLDQQHLLERGGDPLELGRGAAPLRPHFLFSCRTEFRCLQGSQTLLIGEQEGAKSQGSPSTGQSLAKSQIACFPGGTGQALFSAICLWTGFGAARGQTPRLGQPCAAPQQGGLH